MFDHATLPSNSIWLSTLLLVFDVLTYRATCAWSANATVTLNGSQPIRLINCSTNKLTTEINYLIKQPFAWMITNLSVWSESFAPPPPGVLRGIILWLVIHVSEQNISSFFEGQAVQPWNIKWVISLFYAVNRNIHCCCSRLFCRASKRISKFLNISILTCLTEREAKYPRIWIVGFTPPPKRELLLSIELRLQHRAGHTGKGRIPFSVSVW